jgi:hypothetical protein
MVLVVLQIPVEHLDLLILVTVVTVAPAAAAAERAVAQAFSSSPTHFRDNPYFTIIKSVTEMCWIL